MVGNIISLIYVLGVLGLFLISCRIDKDRKTTSYVMLSFFNSLLWPLLLLIVLIMLIFTKDKDDDEIDVSDYKTSIELDRIIQKMDEEQALKELQQRIDAIEVSDD
jgi:hypothetical protein